MKPENSKTLHHNIEATVGRNRGNCWATFGMLPPTIGWTRTGTWIAPEKPLNAWCRTDHRQLKTAKSSKYIAVPVKLFGTCIPIGACAFFNKCEQSGEMMSLCCKVNALKTGEVSALSVNNYYWKVKTGDVSALSVNNYYYWKVKTGEISALSVHSGNIVPFQ